MPTPSANVTGNSSASERQMLHPSSQPLSQGEEDLNVFKDLLYPGHPEFEVKETGRPCEQEPSKNPTGNEESLPCQELLELQLSHGIPNSKQGTLMDLLRDIDQEDKKFPTDLAEMKERTKGDEFVKDLLYRYHCKEKEIEAEDVAPKKLPGMLKSYWNKHKVHVLPYFHRKYDDFNSQWFMDVQNKFCKPGNGIFVPHVTAFKECVLSSFKYLEFPAQSQKQMVSAIIKLLKAMAWHLEENENIVSLSEATEKETQISRAIRGLQPLSRKLQRQAIVERAEKENRKKSNNPLRKEQVAEAIKNYIKCEDRSQFEDKLEVNFKKLQNPLYFPSSSLMSEMTEFFATEFHCSTPLRPKAIYDFPLYALLFRGIHSTDSDGINIPITWDKVFDLGRYIHISAQDRIRLNMYVQLRNRFFSRKPCPDGSDNSLWYLDRNVNLFLSTNSTNIDKVVLKTLNSISIRDKIIETPFITPYDMRRHYCTKLNTHEDPKVRAMANTAAGHGGQDRTSHKIYDDYYNLNQVLNILNKTRDLAEAMPIN